MPSKKTLKKKTKTTTTKTVTEPTVTETPVVETPVVESVSTPVEDTSLEMIDKLITENTAQQKKLREQMVVYRKLKKTVEREQRQKSKAKNKSKSKNTQSGFQKPSEISNDLAQFMSVDSSSLLSRTQVTRFITTYIKDNNLQYAKDRRRIIPDKKLKTLLSVGDTEEITYFNLQKFIKPHFISSTTSVTAS